MERLEFRRFRQQGGRGSRGDGFLGAISDDVFLALWEEGGGECKETLQHWMKMSFQQEERAYLLPYGK